MISRTRYGRAVLLTLAAGVSMASVLQASAQTVPAEENPEAPAAEAAAAPDANDADIRDLQLDWSQLNVDASTLATGPASKARSPQAGRERRNLVVIQGQAERLRRGLGEEIRCRHSGMPGSAPT